MRIIIVGQAASGKDYLRQNLIKKGFIPSISYTSRPKRENEIEGVDYFFISKEDFESKKEKGEFYEWVMFNKNYYGTPKSNFDNSSQIFVMTPDGVKSLTKPHREESIVIYLDTPEDIRFKRLLERPGYNIKERLKVDKKLFYNFSDFDLKISNPDFCY